MQANPLPPEAILSANTVDARGSLTATSFLGIGLMAAIDEIVFHQILAWHHFSTGQRLRSRSCPMGCCTRLTR